MVYLTTEEERKVYELYFEDGLLRRRVNGELLDTDPEGWIFVLRDGKLWAGAKKTDAPPR